MSQLHSPALIQTRFRHCSWKILQFLRLFPGRPPSAVYPEGFAPDLGGEGEDQVLWCSIAGPAGDPESPAGGHPVPPGGGGEGGNTMDMKLNSQQLLPCWTGSSLCVSQVVETLDRTGPAHRIEARLCEIQAGLGSVQTKLERRSSTVAQAEDTQKVKGRGLSPPPTMSVTPSGIVIYC